MENYSKFMDSNVWIKKIEEWKSERQTIVFTNGCFDIIHRGHVESLNEAKQYGDRLIVGLNTDSSIKRIKGKKRPINNQNDRAFVLSALQSVDMVILFDEETPYEILKKIKPDVIVKGGDYQEYKIIGREFAQKCIVTKYIEGYSTTKIIEKVFEGTENVYRD